MEQPFVPVPPGQMTDVYRTSAHFQERLDFLARSSDSGVRDTRISCAYFPGGFVARPADSDT